MHSKDGGDPTQMSLREKIRAMGTERRERNRKPNESNQPKQRIPKGLKRHYFYDDYQSLRWICRQMAFNAMLSLLLGIMLNEIHWSTILIIPARNPEEGPVYVGNNYHIAAEILKVAVTCNVILVLYGLYSYYAASLKLGKKTGALLPQDNFYSAGLLYPYVIECFILAIHPLPGVFFYFDTSEVFGYARFSSDDILTVLMLPRVYILSRVFRDELKCCHESVAYWGTLCGVHLEDPLVIFKQLVLDFPLLLCPFLYLCTILIMAYAMMCFERPTNLEFHSYGNAVWCVFASISTVGFGDLYPTTNFGRFLTAIPICGVALCLYSIMVIGVKNVMEYDAKELKCFGLLQQKRWKVALRLQAVVLIQSFWRSVSSLSGEMNAISTFMRDNKLCLEVRKFRSIRMAEPMEYINIGNEAYGLYKHVMELEDSVDNVIEYRKKMELLQMGVIGSRI